MTWTESEIDHAKEAAQRERSLRTLAENTKWLDEHRDRTVHAAPVRQPSLIDRNNDVGLEPVYERDQWSSDISEPMRKLRSDATCRAVLGLRPSDGELLLGHL